jgi:hypothetical protein
LLHSGPLSFPATIRLPVRRSSIAATARSGLSTGVPHQEVGIRDDRRKRVEPEEILMTRFGMYQDGDRNRGSASLLASTFARLRPQACGVAPGTMETLLRHIRKRARPLLLTSIAQHCRPGPLLTA